MLTEAMLDEFCVTHSNILCVTQNIMGNPWLGQSNKITDTIQVPILKLISTQNTFTGLEHAIDSTTILSENTWKKFADDLKVFLNCPKLELSFEYKTKHYIIKENTVNLLQRTYTLTDIPVHNNDSIVLGITNTGDWLTIPTIHPHMLLQGMSGSGKSIFLMNYLIQQSINPETRIIGYDPEHVIDKPFNYWCDTTDWNDTTEFFLVIQKVMNHRRELLSKYDVDKLGPDTGTFLIIIVIDEYLALKNFCEQNKKFGGEILKIIQDLLARSRKLCFQVIVSLQRGEASILSGYVRSNFGIRVSFHVDNKESVKMLHDSATPEIIDSITDSFTPGLAIASLPNLPGITTFKAPLLAYADYLKIIRNSPNPR